MFFKVDDLKAGPKATMAKLNIWAAAIRWILDWIDAQPTNGWQAATLVRAAQLQSDGSYLAGNATVSSFSADASE